MILNFLLDEWLRLTKFLNEIIVFAEKLKLNQKWIPKFSRINQLKQIETKIVYDTRILKDLGLDQLK